MIEQIIRGQSETTDRSCRLTSRGLEIEGTSRRPRLIPYETIREVNLQSLGALAGVHRYRCTIRSWEHPRLILDNVSFKGQSDADAGTDAYRQFVTRLHRILKQQGATCRFTRGSIGQSLVGWCLLSFILLASAASLMSLGLKGLWLVGCMSPAVPYGVLRIYASRREDYAPDSLPAELLPPSESNAEHSQSGSNVRRRAEVAC